MSEKCENGRIIKTNEGREDEKKKWRMGRRGRKERGKDDE